MARVKGGVTYKQLITKFKNTAEDERKDLLQSHIVKQYVPYEEKLSRVTTIARICNHSSVPDVNEPDSDKTVEVFKRNTPAMFYFLKLEFVRSYTDIKIEDDELRDAYNALEELGILDGIINLIPENEITKYTTMLQMVNDDMYMNERDIPSFFETKVDALRLVINGLLDVAVPLIQQISANANEADEVNEN